MNLLGLIFQFTEMELKHNVVRNFVKSEFPQIKICPECLGTGYDFLDGGQCGRCGGLGAIEDFIKF